ncbi:MAG: proline dehydrogenase family protein [Chloroflexi bacterium]|nr:proline dehydrogenase family protein [Chloroflexota bacterium]
MTAERVAPAPDREAAIAVRGRSLLEAVEPEHLITLSPAWWQERLMEWATQDPEFRVKLLRFVDVLPALRSSEAVASHVRQYFREGAPAAVRLGSAIGRRGPFRPALSRVVRESVFAMAERFVGGATPADALPRLRALVEGGTAYTVDLLGEATLSDAEADGYRDRYLDLLDTLAEGHSWEAPGAIRKPNVSIKLSALTAHFEPSAPAATYDSLRQRLLPVLERARAVGAFVNIDMEQFRYRDLTHEALERIVREEALAKWPDLGIVVQAYLRAAAADLDRLERIARGRGAPITVRLVKGAYWDEEVILARQSSHPVPVFEDKAATDENYERCSERLVAAWPHLRPAFASHNPRSLSAAMVACDEAALPGEAVEFQMLYGMAEGLRRAVAAQRYRTRVYVPAGEIIPGMAYLVRRLLENTSNESWLVNKHEHGDPEEALRPPRPDPSPPPRRRRFRNHPPLEWHRPAVRDDMEAAIVRARRSFGGDHPLLIAGEPVEPAEWIEVRPPAMPSVVMGRAAMADAGHVDRAVAAARAAWPGWRDTSARRRARVLRRAATLMHERRCDLTATMVFESGKPWREADGDVVEAIDFLRYYAAEAERLVRGLDLTTVPGEDNRYTYEGRGVVGVIAPWNFPLAILTGMTAAALAAGNAVVMKPAHQSPIIAGTLGRLLHEAGVPAEALHCLPGRGPEAGKALVEHPDVDMIAFTGGNAAGRAVALAAAEVRPGQRGFKKLLAELGGKNAVIVDEDADLDLAVDGVVASAFGYAGQKCSAASRVIVVGTALDEFRTRLAAAVESLPVGPPEDPYTVVPPVISAEARSRIEEYIRIGSSEGKLVARGHAPGGEGHYVAPHVFENLPPSSPLACEEVFGPVLALFHASGFEEALALALDSPFALTGGLYSRNPRNIALAREHFRVGNLYINRGTTGAMVGRQPFAGFGMSGTGDKAGGPDYVRQFAVTRVVTENTVRRGFAPEWESGAEG